MGAPLDGVLRIHWKGAPYWPGALLPSACGSLEERWQDLSEGGGRDCISRGWASEGRHPEECIHNTQALGANRPLF